MAFKIEAAQRIKAQQALLTADWWGALSKEHQEEYVKEHPNSKYAKEAKEAKGESHDEDHSKPKAKDSTSLHTTDHHKEAPHKMSKELQEYVKTLPKEQQEMFNSGGTKPGSKIRTKAADLVKSKAKGIVKHLKGQTKEWKLCVNALKKLKNKEPLNDHDKAAIKETATDLAIIVGGMALTGGLAHGIGVALGHVGAHFFQEAGLKALAKGLIHGASVKLLGSSDDAMLEALVSNYADMIANADIPDDAWMGKAAKK